MSVGRLNALFEKRSVGVFCSFFFLCSLFNWLVWFFDVELFEEEPRHSKEKNKAVGLVPLATRMYLKSAVTKKVWY